MDIPDSIGRKLYPFSHFLGYRPENVEKRAVNWPTFREKAWVKKAENIVLSGVGAFVGLLLLGLHSKGPAWKGHDVPVIVGSFGAEAVLLFAAPTSPMAQPRNILGSMFLSSLIAVAIAKGFAKRAAPGEYPTGYGDDYIAGPTAVLVTLFVTQLLSIPHPPGGATALLATTNAQVFHLGWLYVAYMMAGSLIMLGWAMIINNIGRRRYPQYWVAPELIKDEERHSAVRKQLLTAPGSAKANERQA